MQQHDVVPAGLHDTLQRERHIFRVYRGRAQLALDLTVVSGEVSAVLGAALVYDVTTEAVPAEEVGGSVSPRNTPRRPARARRRCLRCDEHHTASKSRSSRHILST